MEMNGQFHPPAAFPLWQTSSTNWTGDWVGLWDGLGVLKKKSLFPLEGFKYRTVQPVAGRDTDNVILVPKYTCTAAAQENKSNSPKHNFILHNDGVRANEKP
jgi:hypothetical protein